MGWEMLGDLAPERERGGRIHGVVVGVVTNNQDPDALGRVKLKFPWLSDVDESNWARVATLMAGSEMGAYFLPEVDDEVLVAFEHGRIDRPFVIGALWNGQQKPPAQNGDGKNALRVIKSRSGHTITLDDTDGGEKITIADGQQKNTIVIDASGPSLTLTSEGDLSIKANGAIALESQGDLSIQCANLTIDAQQSLSVKAGADGKVEAQSGLALTCLAGVNVNSGALEVL